MLKIKTGNRLFEVDFTDEQYQTGTLNKLGFEWDIVETGNGSFHIIKDNKSYRAEIVSLNHDEKKFLIKINGKIISLQIHDRYAELLHEMGLDNITTHKVADIKAPMPGLVIDIMIEQGFEVKKGDPLIILEAMKMENILKSPCNGVVKNVKISKGTAVEKNEVLINFE